MSSALTCEKYQKYLSAECDIHHMLEHLYKKGSHTIQVLTNKI